jgi:hypothetical protein
MVKAALQDTAAVFMGGDLDAVEAYSIVNELVVLSRESMQTFLDDMVSI